MRKLFVCVFILIRCLKSAASATNNSKIWHGHTVTIEVVPYQASLRIGTHLIHFCGGSVISKSVVVTAAHCLFDPREASYPRRMLSVELMSVVVGSAELIKNSTAMQVLKVNNTLAHCNYNDADDYANNDIGLVFVEGTFELSNTVKIIPLATEEVDAGTSCIISGWGRLSTHGGRPETLQVGTLSTISYKKCKKEYRFITKRRVCAGGGSDVCKGDSGGPMQCDGVLVGVISLGSCGEESVAIYVKVSSYLEFINDQTCSSIVFRNFGGICLEILIFLVLRLFLSNIYLRLR